ncbi:gluconate 2-dehydrogenase subunit 3 family protein [Jiulongibacter sp. NS-SX5]|uniref:gluconate 2-dehydrogenase subunit 3 family protein n=1 Tax=Jiulongibacter sp. NS-SX5 TaxID=3463854 RepID=UPI0040599481
MQRREALRKSLMMAGVAASGPSLLSLLQSCKEQTRLNWSPQFLSVKQAETISTLVDLILPKTSTPGGLEMKVDMFFDLVYGKLFSAEAKEGWNAQFEEFNALAKEKYGAEFDDLQKDDQIVMLKDQEKSTPKFNGSVWGTAVGEQEPVGFYRSLKSTILWGYFSSEEIGEKVLTYDPIPGPYQGCIPLSEVGNTYSL